MVFTQNYYTVLGISAPAALKQDALRKAYKAALLSAHPDKASASKTPNAYTVDDVREALAVLSDATTRGEFDRWLASQRQGGNSGGRDGEEEEDFVLGLELLDLSDFEAGMPPFVRMDTPSLEGSGAATPDIDFDDLKSPGPEDLAAAVEGVKLDAASTPVTEEDPQNGVSVDGLEEEEEEEEEEERDSRGGG
ncbi:Diphthamide biosynthesis protein 4 [Didymosphaeria variabile]|uniref:Diphthamide biosynthesis protein 4 n=1 Tax=Didymosphaeria variabile TaxID=1932322 RepID=A0A9W8X9K4_9PLEO|nr:Diphthamide biosynthesis protein 4 [Didymosphaeria variabile]KAJ4344691.1 Diphthamide biosynthesis protein 4 [Didymosphaeria variabile]